MFEELLDNLLNVTELEYQEREVQPGLSVHRIISDVAGKEASVYNYPDEIMLWYAAAPAFTLLIENQQE